MVRKLCRRVGTAIAYVAAVDIRLIEPLGLSVLIADADAGSAAMLNKMLSFQGYRIGGIAAEPDEMTAQCAGGAPDVIVINAGAL